MIPSRNIQKQFLILSATTLTCIDNKNKNDGVNVFNKFENISSFRKRKCWWLSERDRESRTICL